MCWNQERKFLLMKNLKKEAHQNEHFAFYETDNVYGALFFQFPKVLMYGQKYRGLSDTAKLAYMVLKDRLEYSLRNNWVDSEGHVYFIFTNEELKDLFNCSNDKLNKVKQELENVNLLFQKHIGFNPETGKNEPNRLYLSKLDVKATDVYLRGEYDQKAPQSLGMSGLPKNRNPHESVKSLDTSGLPKNRNPHEFVKNSSQSLDTSGLPKNRRNLEEEPNNLDTFKDTYKDTGKPDLSSNNYSLTQLQKQNEDLVNHACEYLIKRGQGSEIPLEPETIKLLSLWVNTPKQMHDYIGIIFNAKKTAEKEIKRQLGKPITIILDDEKDLQYDITAGLRRAFNVLRKKFDNHEKVNANNYLYKTMVNTFEYWYNSINNSK
ncbi:plasmid replication initiation protein [Lactobacillus hilgardii]